MNPKETLQQLLNTVFTLNVADHESADAYGKFYGMTVTFAAWHPSPNYLAFKTGTLLSRNDEYPSGLILVDDKGKPHQYKV